MDSEGKKFGRGRKELTGAVDLITHYKLLPHHEFFCKRTLPVSIADTHYLYNVVGDTQIRKGDGMQLDPLIQNPSHSHDNGNLRLHRFDMDVLRDAFHLKETAPVELPSTEKGIPTIPGKSKSESKDKEKHKKHKDRDKEHKKHKHRHKDRNKDKDNKDRSVHQDSSVGEHSKKHHDKKRKHDCDEDVNDIHNTKRASIRAPK